MGNNNKKSILNSEAFPGILLLAATILALILANTQLNKYYNYVFVFHNAQSVIYHNNNIGAGCIFSLLAPCSVGNSNGLGYFKISF